MAQFDNAQSLMERMETIDKNAQERRSKRMQEYYQGKPSRDYYKGLACEHLDERITECECKHELFASLTGLIEKDFEPEEWLEIHAIVKMLLSNKDYFDQYCINHGLKRE